MDQARRLQLLVEKVHPQSRLLRTWELQGGISARMTGLEIALPGGERRKLLVRQPSEAARARNPRSAADEFRLLQHMQTTGVATPAPYLLDESGDLFAQPVMLIEYIEGEPLFAPTEPGDFVSQMAAQLVHIHQVTASYPTLSFVTKQAERLAPWLESRTAPFDDSVQEGRIRAALTPVWPLPQPRELALLHGDFWPGNVLWRNEQLVAVIDWENAVMGHPLADLAVSRLDILWVCGVDAMHEFTRCYRAATDIDLSDLPYWDLYAALRPASCLAEWAAVYPTLGRPDITEETMRRDHRVFTEQALAKLGL